MTNPNDAIKRIAVGARLLQVDDSTGIQVVQVELLAGEVRNLSRLQEYGITTVPLPGSQGIAISVNGQRGQMVMINADDLRYRPVNLEPGDVCIYTYEGTLVHLQKGKKIRVYAAENITLESGSITLDGDVICKKTLKVIGAAEIQGVDFLTHDHDYMDGSTRKTSFLVNT